MATYKRIDGDYVITTINSSDSILLESNQVDVSGNLTIGGSVTVANVIIGNLTAINISGTLTTANQPYITRVGNLVSLTVLGNLQAQNSITTPTLTAGTVEGTLTTANQPNVTGLGTLSQLAVSGNTTLGNLTVSGTLNAGDITVSSISNGTSNVDIVGSGGNVTTSVGGNANILTVTGTGVNVAGTLNTTGIASIGGNADVSGNFVVGGFYFGDGGFLSNVVANVASTTRVSNGLSQIDIAVANGNITFDVFTTVNVAVVSQDGITVSGNITGTTDATILGNITAGGNINGSYFLGNGSQLTGIDATSIQFGNSRVKVVSSGGNIIANVADITIQNWHTGGVDILGNVAANVIDVDTTAVSNPAYREGRLFYDTAVDALAYYNSVANLTLAIGQDTVQRVINGTGNAMTAGQVVYLTGADISGVPTVALSQADNFNTSYTSLGLITSNIAPGGSGFVQTNGLIEAIDTSAFAVGDTVHVSPSTAGGLVNFSPTYPYFPIQIGVVLVANAVNGCIYIDPQVEVAETLRVVGDTRFDTDVTVAGNLSVYGTTTTTSTTNLEVANSFIYLGSGDTIGPGGTTFTGSGLNDGVFVGHYTGSGTTSYYVKIDGVGTGNAGVDTFAWSTDNFVSNVATNVDITGTPQALSNNISIEFNATTGHTLNDVWSGNAAPTNVQIGIVGNYNPGTYAHTGLFRNINTGVWAFFDGYTPEPQGNINITDPSYQLAPLQANVIYANTFSGNGSAITNINGANITGSINIGSTANIDAGNVIAAVDVTATGNVTGGNVIAAVDVTATGNVTSGNVITTGIVSASGNITGSYFIGNGSQLTGIDATSIQFGNSSMRVLSSGGDIAANVAGTVVGTFNSSGLETVGITNSGANGTGNIGNATSYFNTVFAKATSAQYADLAELYLADADYMPGTVVEFGGDQEITICQTANSHRVAGVVSENPAHIMNAGLVGDHVVKLALVGRVRCLIRGPVKAGDILVSDINGWARVNNDAAAGRIIGKSLGASDQDGYVEIVVGKH